MAHQLRMILCVGDPAQHQRRILVEETLDPDCGPLTRDHGAAGGVVIVVTPEQGPLSGAKLLEIARRLEEAMATGREQPHVRVVEGVTLTPPMSGHPAHALAVFLRGFFHRAYSPFPALEVRESTAVRVQSDPLQLGRKASTGLE